MNSHYENVLGEVVTDVSDTKWECLLTQTNVELRRNCWFKMKLVLQNEQYIVAWHGGRIGVNSRVTQRKFKDNVEKAKEFFCVKFHEKTNNNFLGDKFQYVPDMYDMVPSVVKDNVNKFSNYTSEDDLATKSSDIKYFLFRNNLHDWKFDMYSRKRFVQFDDFPTEQIKTAITTLEKIQSLMPVGTTNPDDPEFIRACNEFYQKIPHTSDKAVTINDESIYIAKIQLLMRLDTSGAAKESLELLLSSYVDSYFLSLKVNVTVLPKESPEYDIIEKVLKNTHGPTHRYFTMELLDIHKIHKTSPDIGFSSKEPRNLLFHGSSVKNFTGILREGLRIAPPNVPAHGYMFGKGIYFTTISSKAAQYCGTTPQSKIGLIALCEVHLGVKLPLTSACRAAEEVFASAGSDKVFSVHGKGYFSCTNIAQMDDDVCLQDGPLIPPYDPKVLVTHTGLLYNEYVIYKEEQAKVKYLLRVKIEGSN